MHSTIVGGSSAKRVIACPGSVALAAKVPERESSVYAEEGTFLHTAITAILNEHDYPELTPEQRDEKIAPALELLDLVDPDKTLEFDTEVMVDFGDYMPGVFGSADVLGRIGKRAIVLDWKFGSGIIVDAVENEQLMFYAAAAMRTPNAAWAFDGIEDIELIIIQPPEIRRWVTTPARIRKFELSLKRAVKESALVSAKLKHGDHCRFCPAKAICPVITGAVDRAMKEKIDGIDAPRIGAFLKNADLLEEWIKDLRALAFQMMESGKKVPGWKLVAKRGLRKWADEQKAIEFLGDHAFKPRELVSPAQAEKVVKAIPAELIVSISSGSTLALESDPRPEILQIGQQLSVALSKLQ